MTPERTVISEHKGAMETRVWLLSAVRVCCAVSNRPP